MAASISSRNTVSVISSVEQVRADLGLVQHPLDGRGEIAPEQLAGRDIDGHGDRESDPLPGRDLGDRGLDDPLAEAGDTPDASARSTSPWP